jgi:hypothetical protein
MSRIRAINMGAREKPNTNSAIVAIVMTKQLVTLEKLQKTAKTSLHFGLNSWMYKGNDGFLKLFIYRSKTTQ